MGSGAYLVSRKGARLLLKLNPPENPWRASDDAMDPWAYLKHDKLRCLPKLFDAVPCLSWQHQEPGAWKKRSFVTGGLNDAYEGKDAAGRVYKFHSRLERYHPVSHGIDATPAPEVKIGL